ncbi:hypothetical protein [Rhizobium leguminosarum]|uniref:hypothetical protein n=1 Tax=Rhizobium leguminosarum TaxID=384 RepID=UPI0010313FC0|nr:hypothetical protein [Rhizobium leguminosarum]TAY99662.1 hypothetical protein ELH79_14755 [Rhizobium leguminosarum]TAZ10532.1 hypothetical protein ELH78_15640 [Rhizobium leguminosarum]
MKMLRFGELDGNSSARSFERRIATCELLSSDLQNVLHKRRLPLLDALKTPVIEEWAIECYFAPMLTGHIHYPNQPAPMGPGWLSFTMPIELLSVQQKLARSSESWYRLGAPGPWAADTVKAWSSSDDR